MMRMSIAALLALSLVAIGAGAADESPAVPAGKPIDEVIKGKIVSLEKDVVEIHYDFEDEAQLEDWVEFKPFRVGGSLETSIVNGSVQLKGVGALHLKVGFTGYVRLECDLVPMSDRDLGLVVAENAESENYVLYCINDIYFQRNDGVRTPQHMVTRFGVKDPSEPADARVFRYIARGKEPTIQTYQKIKISAEKNDQTDTWMIADTKYSGKEPGRPFDELLAGLYVVKASAQYSRIVVRGRVSKGWLEREGVVLTLSKPLAAAVEMTQAEKDARKLLKRLELGAGSIADLIPVIDNAEVTVPTREAAAAAILASGDLMLVPNLVVLLYSEDLPTRTIGNDLVKGMTSKNFGYDPKADEEKRSRAIVKVVEYLQKYPRKFGTGR